MHQRVEALSEDPTATKTLREKYASRLRARYAAIMTAINQAIKNRDVLGLENEALVTPPRNFNFASTDRKADRFADWLEGQLDNEVLEVVDRSGNQYIRSAQERGIKAAQSDMRKAGYDVPDEDPTQLMNLPVHRDKAQLLYTRNYRELEGINRAVGNQVSQELTQGLLEGRGTEDMARSINDRIDAIGRTRATTLAHTEVIHAHAEGKLDTYERLGLDEVVGSVEISTANDRRVCSQCESLHGRKMSIDDARGVIPQHPRCRCTWVAVTKASR